MSVDRAGGPGSAHSQGICDEIGGDFWLQEVTEGVSLATGDEAPPRAWAAQEAVGRALVADVIVACYEGRQH